MGLEIEVSTEDMTVILRTDVAGYDPMVLSDMVNQLPDLMAKAEAFILSHDDDDDDVD